MRNYAFETKNRVDFIRNILSEAHADGIVYGNSGGKDSALVGILCKMAHENTIGLIMPGGTKRNYEGDRIDAERVAEQYKIPVRIIDLSSVKSELLRVIRSKMRFTDTALANIMPRLRMATLYAIAANENRLVAGTGNLSEGYMGYFTKWGDGAFDFNPIADLTVTEIYEFLRYLGAPNTIINKEPSAGLYDGQTDEKEMGVAYSDIDKFLLTGTVNESAKVIIEKFHKSSEHKRRMPIIYEDHMSINKNYLKLKNSYLFSMIAKKVNDYKTQNSDKEIIKLGIGDVTLPLVPAVITAMQQAVAEMGNAETFRGYGEEQGYAFLRKAVCGYYDKKGVTLQDNEVFISDGAKSDIGNILDIFSTENTVLIPDPVYPVYLDTNIMAGRNIIYMNGNAENGFLPLPNKNTKANIIYLCSPNNPTGAVYNREQLKLWVEYALENDAIILFDSAYEIFIRNANLPTSIYQTEGADKCAIEFCSLSKMAGFTGTRCGYTIVPHNLVRNSTALNKLWLRRQSTKFNGVPYIIQRGAEAVFTDEGLSQVKSNIDYYMQNARIITDTLTNLGIWFTGGINSPYIWFKCPSSMLSWEFFDYLLEKMNVIGTPGAGFGANGEGFFRLTAFGNKEDVEVAMRRFGR
jgi:LL-diaminopimelate aminotransferase